MSRTAPAKFVPCASNTPLSVGVPARMIGDSRKKTGTEAGPGIGCGWQNRDRETFCQAGLRTKGGVLHLSLHHIRRDSSSNDDQSEMFREWRRAVRLMKLAVA